METLKEIIFERYKAELDAWMAIRKKRSTDPRDVQDRLMQAARGLSVWAIIKEAGLENEWYEYYKKGARQ